MAETKRCGEPTLHLKLLGLMAFFLVSCHRNESKPSSQWTEVQKRNYFVDSFAYVTGIWKVFRIGGTRQWKVVWFVYKTSVSRFACHILYGPAALRIGRGVYWYDANRFEQRMKSWSKPECLAMRDCSCPDRSILKLFACRKKIYQIRF